MSGKPYVAYPRNGMVVIFRNGEQVRSFMTPTYRSIEQAVEAFRKELEQGRLMWAGFHIGNTEVR